MVDGAVRPGPGRARVVVDLLRDLWGDELPRTVDPALTLIEDALALDDESGREDRVVVQGDGLTHEALAALLRLVPVTAARRLLPPDLLGRLGAPDGEEPRASAPLMDPAVGAWELDPGTGRVSWDARCAQLLGAEGSGAPLSHQLEAEVHPEDRDAVRDALAEALTSGGEYRARFRARQADGSWAWRSSSGRVVRLPDGGSRLLGLIAAS
ncbi:PAS domain-containing protein [Kineococcus sp. SYSU DK004]|uniref:PAS domain-containing protein n=1 Tax=Kineococcus sp. SYSU DK004 TaxID=3383125 RepID=UPI003D7EF15D